MTQRNALDRAIEAGAGFDWITPLTSLLSGNAHIGTMREDQNLADATMCAAGISQRRRNVRDDYYNFDVDRADGDRAVKALTAAGIAAWRL